MISALGFIHTPTTSPIARRRFLTRAGLSRIMSVVALLVILAPLNARADSLPSRPYWPLTPNSWVDYNVLAITGTWHPDAMALDILSQTAVPANGFQRITAIQSGNLIGQVYGQGGVTRTTLDPIATLYEDVDPSGLGERSGNGRGIGVPGCLLLPNDLTVGHLIETASEIYNTDLAGVLSKSDAKFHSRNMVRYQGPRSGQPDVVVIGYWERPEVSAIADTAVYNYEFTRGIGLTSFWYGVIGPGSNTLKWGIVYYMTAHGGQLAVP